MRRNPLVSPISIRITATKQTDVHGAPLPDTIVIEMDGETVVKDCDQSTARKFIGEVRTTVKDWIAEL